MLFLCVYTDKGVKNVKVAGHNPVEIQLGEAVFTIKELNAYGEMCFKDVGIGLLRPMQ